MFFPKPKYLHRVFLHLGNGFHFLEEPDILLSDSSIFNSENHWEIIAAVLYHAKQGDFTKFNHILNILVSNEEAEVWSSCATLIGFAAPSSFIKELLNTFQDELFASRHVSIQKNVCDILNYCGQIWVIPHMLKIYEHTNDKTKELIQYDFSKLLEPFFGLIWDLDINDINFNQTVVSKLENLKSFAESEYTSILYGNLINVKNLANRLHKNMAKSLADDDEVSDDRLIFEAYTGLNCSEFYTEDAILDQSKAFEIMEKYTNSEDFDFYKIGTRYFFKHPIPNQE